MSLIINIKTDGGSMNKLPRRKNIRLKNYDYSRAGYYFITICTQDKLKLFGEIINAESILNNRGEMIKKWIFQLENKFPHISIHKYIIMPNHIHCIIILEPDLRVYPKNNTIKNKQYEHTGPPLPQIIQWFKTMTTNEYIKGVKNEIYPPFNKRIWQRNYYDRIIRNEQEYKKIYEYIETNPLKWENDKYYI